MQREPISERARGRWRGILPAIGISADHLINRHGPCPVCGGKDRFRFDDKEGSGTFYCTHCGAGDGVKLVMIAKGCDFKEAAAIIESQIGTAPVEPARKEMTDAQKRQAMNRLWKASKPIEAGDPVSKYLERRLGSVVVPSDIRFADRCRYQSDTVSYHPAMIAMIRDAEGVPCLLHRTYITVDGRKADLNPCRRLMPGDFKPGSAVRLMPHGKMLGIAEGIETAWAASILHRVPVWAALNTSMLEQWRPPENVESVIVFGDHDDGYAGQKAAYALAFKLGGKLSVSVKIPDEPRTDWADILTRKMTSESGEVAA
jgi:putative DNA primase/helicase